MNEDFYIGWSNKLPPTMRRVLIVFIGAIFVVAMLVMYIWQKQQTGFGEGVFEYGHQVEYTGKIFEYPAPMLRVRTDNGTQSIPLVNFGKFGVQEILTKLKEEYGDLTNKEVTLRGTRIHFDGRTWLELTDEIDAVVQVTTSKPQQQQISEEGSIMVTGEIVDPKCFFGVMKPGFGKVHMSCAIRCISGGIPPILTTNPNPEGTRDYYFLTTSDGRVNDEVLRFIGFEVSIEGKLSMVDDWSTIELQSIKVSKAISTSPVFTACVE